jgi:regulator of G-protein signaling
MVFSKMERIVEQMQHPVTGVPVRSLKNFLTTVPSAFTGYDLVGWLMEHLNIDDTSEAVHLGGLFCQYGYIFPIIDSKTSATLAIPLALKDDSTLYRFQTPYFWPSVSLRPDHIEYAIYLTKRNLRSKQKYGLDEHEQATLVKLQKTLCDKWDFICLQAQEQLRLLKEKTKADKMVISSQERAYWRTHHPLPGHVNCLEEDKKNLQPIHLHHINKRNIDGLHKEVEFLQSSLKFLRMKLSKVFESYQNRYELYHEHDPFLEPPLPSNPWITDDISLWALDAIQEGTLTRRRVKRWSFGLEEVLRDAAGLHEFHLFLQKEFSSENIRFWLAVESFKHLPLSQVEQQAVAIYREFLAQGAPCEVNIDSATMAGTVSHLGQPNRLMFDAAQMHIFLLMKKDSYPRFIRSMDYKNLLATAFNPTSRKKFFTFGVSGTKKGSLLPSPKAKRRGSTSRVAEKLVDDEPLATNNTLSQHSYSTGNLKDIDTSDRSDRSGQTSPFGSCSNIESNSIHQPSSRLSPGSLKKRLEKFIRHGGTPTHHSNLQVPQTSPHVAPAVSSINTEATCPIRSTLIDVNINVPCNVVTPWDDFVDVSGAI